jgi:tetratricopeptide (TPR) repeat protein
MRQPTLRLKLAGPVRLTGPDGCDLTPRPARAKALLAMLGVSPGRRRPRPWVQDKLWSDRPPAQGAGSLRQLLTEIRDALGPHRDCLRAEAGWLALDEERVEVALDPEPDDWELTGEPPEFAAGLDVPDPEFEDWLRDLRAAYDARLSERPAPPAHAAAGLSRTVVLIAPAEAEDGALRTLADMAAAEVAERMGSVAAAEAVFAAPDAALRARAALSLHVSGVMDRDGALLQAQWRDPARGAVLTTLRRLVRRAAGRRGEAGPVDLLVAETTTAGILELGKRARRADPADAEAAAHRALSGLPVFDSVESALECDRLLARAAEANPSAVLRAYRAQLRVVAILERMPGVQEHAGQEAVALIDEALRDDPSNPMIAAIAAEVALHVEGRPEKAMTLAEQAVARDPANPLIRSNYAQALAFRGETRRAHTEALTALKLAAGHPRIASWHMRCCVTAVRRGLYKDALRFARTAHELSPTFKPPLRFLAALCFHLGDETGAATALAKLKALEPDFSLDLMASPDYPVASLRATPLIGVTRSRLL